MARMSMSELRQENVDCIGLNKPQVRDLPSKFYQLQICMHVDNIWNVGLKEQTIRISRYHYLKRVVLVFKKITKEAQNK